MKIKIEEFIRLGQEFFEGGAVVDPHWQSTDPQGTTMLHIARGVG
jgi:hypothetical protein